MRGHGSVSPVDSWADSIAALTRRVSALERISHVHLGTVSPPAGYVGLDGGTPSTVGANSFDGGTPSTVGTDTLAGGVP